MSIEWIDDSLDAIVDLTSRLAEGGANVAVLCNTVARAQATYRLLCETSPSVSKLLLHARFPSEDRSRLEAKLVGRLGKGGDRPRGMIVVGTQVLEQSLDVDFDALLTDLAPVDLLLQRAGRLHRHQQPARPDCARVPVLRIVAPGGDPGTASLADVARVYEAYVVRRTLLTLSQRSEIRLPEDIEPLVEGVYAGDEPPAWADVLREERAEMTARRDRDESLAKGRVWPPPTTPDDPFGNLDMPFEEDNPDIARMLRAETRLGDAGTEVVCLFGSEADAYLDRARARPVDLAREPSRDDVRALALRTVRVSTRGLAQAIGDRPSPRAWADISVLARRRPLFFGAEPVCVGDFRLQLDDDLGLVIDRAKGSEDGVSSDD